MVLADTWDCAVYFWNSYTTYAERTDFCTTDFVWHFFDSVSCGGNSDFKCYADDAD